MNDISLRRVQAAADRLPEQILILQDILEELELAEQTLRRMSYTGKSIQYIIQCRQEIMEETEVLYQMKDCLDEVIQIYNKVEQNITDTYNLEQLVYPKTVFGTSRIDGLEQYEHLFFWNS